MSTRWLAGQFNTLARIGGGLTSPDASTDFYPVSNLAIPLPMRTARFVNTGQNDVLIDSLLSGGSPFLVRAGERLWLNGTTGAATIQNLRSRNFLQNDGSWAPGSVVLVPPFAFTVEPYSVLQWPSAYLAVSATHTAEVIPALNALTIHGHSDLWQLDDAIQWHAGSVANPTALVAQALPLAHTQLLDSVASGFGVVEGLRYHRISFFGTAPFVGTVVLGYLDGIDQCFSQGRLITYRAPQGRLNVSSGFVASYPWALRDSRGWQGTLRFVNGGFGPILERVFRAAMADPMVWLPEDGVVMMGWVQQTLGPRALGPDSFSLDLIFDEAPLPLNEPTI